MNKTRYTERLTGLKDSLAQHNVDAYIVPLQDIYGTEYLLPWNRRLEWISGFTGSSGLAIISSENQAIFVDGRYTLQAGIECSEYSIEPYNFTSIGAWFIRNLPKAAKIGIDPSCLTVAQEKQWQKVLESNQNALVPLSENLIDLLWTDRPVPFYKPFFIHPLSYYGEDAYSRLKKCFSFLEGREKMIITGIDSIAWALGLRGHDLDYTPFPFCFMVVDSSHKIDLFLPPESHTQEITDTLGAFTTFHHHHQLPEYLKGIDGPLYFNPKSLPLSLKNYISEQYTVEKDDPCQLQKAIKNSTEQQGMRNCHNKDAIAIIECWQWIEENIDNQISELDVVTHLRGFREKQALFFSDSFPTIVGYGSNGAIVHYRPRSKTNRIIDKDSLLLLDSGGQYLDGTTDITRTFYFGETPSDEHILMYTKVLQGHIRLSMASFPSGTKGSQIDCLARESLWEMGKDYAHGTGHGVGFFLNVHEGPCRISKTAGDCDLQPGMVLSIEPGYYKNNDYGIRIENLACVQRNKDIDENTLCFETLTKVPYDKKLINPSLLSQKEIDWLNSYHQSVYEGLKEHLSPQLKEWLYKKTEPYPL